MEKDSRKIGIDGSAKLEIPDDPGRRGVVGIAVRDDGRFLVIRRSRHVVAPGMYCFPGGGIEGEETEAEALRREFVEEVGAEVEPVRRVWQCMTDWKVELSWWHVRLINGECLKPNQAEVDRIDWFSAGEMAALPNLLPSNYDFLAGLLDGSITM